MLCPIHIFRYATMERPHLYSNFDITLFVVHLARVCQRHTTWHAPWDMLYFVPVPVRC